MNAPKQNLRPETRVSAPELGPGQPMMEEAPPKRRRGRRILVWLIVLLVVAGGAGYWYMTNMMPPPGETAAVPAEPAAPPPPVVLALAPIEVAEVAPQPLTETVRVTGTLNPSRSSALAAQVGGTVETVAARPGERVDAGTVLVEINSDTLKAQLAQQQSALAAAEAGLQLAESARDRTRTLVQRNVSTDVALEQAENQVTSAQSQLAAAKSGLESATIALGNASVKAPFAGVIAERMVEPGEAVSPGSPLLTLVDLSSLEVQVTVPTSVISKIALGQETELTVEGIAGDTFTAEVGRISPVALAGTRAIPVFLTIENTDNRLRGGMFAVGAIVVEQKASAIALPNTAIRTDADGKFVLKIVDGQTVRQAVTPGREWNGGALIEIADGVKAGDTIVTAPLPDLHAGTAVTVDRS